MSKSHKRISEYVLMNLKDAAFMTAAGLGDMAGVSESTVVRFAYELGYDGYSSMQKDMAEAVKNNLDLASKAEPINLDKVDRDIFAKVLANDAKNINDTIKLYRDDVFDNALELIVKAKKVYIIGLRNSKPLASILEFYLNLYRDNVINILTNSSSEIFEQMIHISSEDLVIGISFPDYNVRTLHALEFASERQASIITITDSPDSPIGLYSTYNIAAACNMTDNIVSMTAPLSVVNAIIVALGYMYKDNLKDNVNEIGKILDNFCQED